MLTRSTRAGGADAGSHGPSEWFQGVRELYREDAERGRFVLFTVDPWLAPSRARVGAEARGGRVARYALEIVRRSELR